MDYSAMCPNCGETMDIYPWDINDTVATALGDSVLVSQGSGNGYEFSSFGPVYHNGQALMTYATDKQWFLRAFNKSNVIAIFVRPDDCAGMDQGITTFIVSEDPAYHFMLMQNWLVSNGFYGRQEPSIILSDDIHPSAQIADTGVVIEYDVKIDAGVVIYPNTLIKRGSIISAGSIIGVNGARLVTKKKDGERLRVIHGGGVRIGEDVFIGANAVIVKSVWREPTAIGNGTFIGNLVNIGHNCSIGCNTTILPGSILCGRTRVEPGATLAPGVITNNAVTIGAGSRATLGSIVVGDTAPFGNYTGFWAQSHDKFIEDMKIDKRLRRQFNDFEQQ